MFFNRIKGFYGRRAVAAGVAFLALASGVQAATLTGTFGLTVYQGHTGGTTSDNQTQQALESNTLTTTNCCNFKTFTGTYTGALNMNLNASSPNTVDAFLTNAGGTYTGTQLAPFAVLSTPTFDDVTIFVFTGTFAGPTTGTITHDDGIGLYDAANNLVTGLAAAAPTTAITTSFSISGGAFTLYYVSANGLPSVLDVEASTTPLPAALPLFAGGLGVVGLLARRKKRKVALAA